MSPALRLLLCLACCTLLRGTPLPPRDVRLEAQNFHIRLRWEPDPGSAHGAAYQAEWRSRVRAVAGGNLSEWVSSRELQPYRDTIVGPPKLSWVLQGQDLCVNITMPLTPYRGRTGSYQPVDRVLLKLWYWLRLFEGDTLIQQVPCRQGREDAPCSFRFLKPSTQYCVRSVAADVAEERSREAEQCLLTPAGPAGFPWVTLAVLSSVLLLLSVAGLCVIQLYVFSSPSETHLPKTLTLLNRELSVAIRVPTLELEEDSLALLLPTMLPSHSTPATEQTVPTVQRLLRESLSQDTHGYCANGFGPDCQEGRDPSCSCSQLGSTLGLWVSPQLGQHEETRDGDDVPELPVLMGLTRDCYTGDGDFQASEPWLSLHLQLYSKCQCPAPGADSCLPPPTPGRSLSQESPWDSLSMAGHWVPLRSVKLLDSKEEDGGKLIGAPQPLHAPGTEPQTGGCTAQPGDSGQGVPLPSPSQQPPLPLDVLGAAAWSGYELRAPAACEP
ncbi:uncharacterized protein LJ264_008571 isoform 2-T3 [Porphyrio hochstetteri]